LTRVLGIDYGDRHVGLALSDPLRITAQPLASYEITGRENVDRKFFQDLVAKHDVGEIVLGHPLRMDGTAGTRSEKTRAFAAWLEKAVGRPVALIDERLTTRQALKTLDDEKLRGRKKKDWEDRIAAVIILSTYLESKRGTDDGPEVA
jgi:putative holliday junction resolvase